MKKLILAAMSLSAVLSGCKEKNPLLAEFDTPFQTPPFDKIEVEHYIPAIETAIKEMKRGVEAIAADPAGATFENTIVAFERTGERLDLIAEIFYNLNSSETSPQMDSIAPIIQAMTTEASNDISLDSRIFARVKHVYEQKDSPALAHLTAEDRMLLEKTYRHFTRNGAGLSDADKQTYRKITAELSALSLKFKMNLQAATNSFQMILTERQVDGLPDFAKASMKYEAELSGKEGYLLTLQAPSYNPYMTYATDRQVKEHLWRMYGSRCFGEKNDNTPLVKRIAELRLQLANLLGYGSYADYALEDRMTGSAGVVNDFLAELLVQTRPYADKEFQEIRRYAAAEGLKDLKPWDFARYEEQYKQGKYNFSEEEVKPYFQLENVQKGIFLLAEKLYGLSFVQNPKIPVYHPDVKAFEVYDGNRLMAILYMDFFPREGKRPGAWMNTFRDMYRDARGKEIRPFVTLNCNFTKPTATSPSLLTFTETSTFLHEFGHGLHGILAEGTYRSLTGTNVYRDFVELPSQIMENWLTEKEFLDLWAVHYRTGEKMPVELIQKIVDAKTFMAAYHSVRQLAFGMNDMAWHTITAPVAVPVDAFEREATGPAQFFPFEKGTCVSTSFSHIFSGGYAAGYYSYKWAEVLEADAFSLFREKGIFDPQVARSFRDNILSKGGSEDPMDLYVRFRGHKPDNHALLRKMGIECTCPDACTIPSCPCCGAQGAGK